MASVMGIRGGLMGPKIENVEKPMVLQLLFQNFRLLAPPSPHMYPSHLPSKLFRLHFSLSDHFFHDMSENMLPAAVRSMILNIDTKHV